MARNCFGTDPDPGTAAALWAAISQLRSDVSTLQTRMTSAEYRISALEQNSGGGNAGSNVDVRTVVGMYQSASIPLAVIPIGRDGTITKLAVAGGYAVNASGRFVYTFFKGTDQIYQTTNENPVQGELVEIDPIYVDEDTYCVITASGNPGNIDPVIIGFTFWLEY